MKLSSGLAGLSLLLLAQCALAEETGRIEVEVDGIRSDEGQIFVSLFDRAESFPGDASGAFRTLSARQAGGRATVVFADVPKGAYAVAAHHDEDGNGKMKTVYGTIPLEGIGISRDAKGVMGPPKFDDAKFALDSAAVSITVHIHY